jgi:DNA-binding transcriptional LysR family regulator
MSSTKHVAFRRQLNSTASGFRQQRLLKDRFVGAVRANHPRIADTLTLDQFEDEWHVVLTTPGSGMDVVEKAKPAPIEAKCAGEIQKLRMDSD